MKMTIGQFSVLSEIPVTTLRFWEKNGIFVPAFVNPQSGYRYYDTDQLEQIHIITSLQKCGLSNMEIRRCVTPGTHTEIFASRIAELHRAKRRLEEAIHTLNFCLEDEAGRSVIVLKSIPELRYLSSRKRFSDTHEMHREFARIVDYIHKYKLVSRQPFQTVGIFREDILNTKNFDCECIIRIKSAPPDCPFVIKTIPAIESAITIMHKGRYDIPERYYNLLLASIETNRYSICGSIREWFVTDPYDGRTEEDHHVAELQIPITVAK